MNGLHASAQPAHGARQRYLIATQLIGSGFEASRALRSHRSLLDRGQQPRHPRGEKVGQETEGLVALRAVPTGDAYRVGYHTRVTAVSSERAAPTRVQRTTLESCVAPFLLRNVVQRA